VSLKDNFLGTIQNYLFTLVVIVAIGMFIYTGFNLFSARGDEKAYSQAWKAFAYTIVGLAIIPLSYVLVKVVL
jgi:heme O synthase-like polyprenyltransferase